MILRKPYAFLIKYFKVIHLVLTVLLAFILYKTNDLLNFFNEYLSSGNYGVLDDLFNGYIGVSLYLSIFLVIGISAIIFWLMFKKDKPVKYYLINIIYYIVLIIGLVFVNIQFENISLGKTDVLTLNITRDILLVLFFVQIPLVIISLIRTVGFNIKKFNFQRDLMELQIDDKDNEEFELGVDIDSDDVKARFRRRKRFIKYALKENKILVLVLTGVALIIGGVIVHNTIYVKNIIYKENKTFKSSGLEMTVIDSYQYDTDFFGNDISKKKYSYTIARVRIKNISGSDRQISLKTFTLKIGDEIYSATEKEKDSFIPLGTTGNKLNVANNEEKTFIIIFKINKEDKTKKKIMEYAGSYKMNGNERIYNIDRIRLEPKTFEKTQNIKTSKIGEELTFNESILKNTSIVIESFEVNNRYTYSYKQCMDECYTFNDYIVPSKNTKYDVIVMKLKLNINVDPSINNPSLQKQLIYSVAHLRYVIGEKEYNQKFNIQEITPSIVKDYKYFEVKGNVKNADEIYLDFVILDKVYTYVLKGA